MTPRDAILDLKARMSQDIVGQEHILERLLIGLLANGNLLVEGLPGLAKTRAVKSLAKHLDAGLSRIQFTPDLLPSDVTGTEIYHQVDGKGEFRFQPGPIFNNLILADEINRAPAKVQAALLEAMEERQVTVAGTTHKLPSMFLVMATQNPIQRRDVPLGRVAEAEEAGDVIAFLASARASYLTGIAVNIDGGASPVV